VFHVKQPPSSKWGGKLLADAEGGEDAAEHLLRIDPAGDAVQGAGRQAHVLGGQFQGVILGQGLAQPGRGFGEERLVALAMLTNCGAPRSWNVY